MAKKIALDFSKVEERSGWNTKEMPEGLHEFKIELVDDKDANDGTSMWTYGLRPTNPKYKTRLFPYYCKHQANQLWKLRDLFVAAGIPVPKKKVNLDPNAPIGKLIAGDVGPGTGNFSDRSEISGVYDTSILEDDGAASDDEDEVDEDEVEDEVDDEAEEVEDDEEYDDEEEEGDDELREEIEGLTLAALRKRAKGLDIDTDGVKKDELVELVIEAELEGEEDSDEEDDLDYEDLDDEELEDENFDDEEEEDEEPEPVKPARRAAPARKPAAKAAPAAAARRTVKRR